MASDDPPFLELGTEVSAKYRGAFCEAKVKTVHRCVKVKVNVGKGSAIVVDHDAVKEGSLKLGGKVVVKAKDGTLSSGTITKLNDASVYTVVFDDGDERTLKRSSLVLKGGRHYHESETLDTLPLTNPENFGSPVGRQSRKRGKPTPPGEGGMTLSTASPKRRRVKQRFGIGQVVFLENDRRKASWLPAVVVPSTFVTGETDSNDDSLYVRSFKDGRFYGVDMKDLHEFSNSEEPLKSIISGDLQIPQSHRSGIDRAIRFIQTGQLPWDMDLTSRSLEQKFHNITNLPRLSLESSPESVSESHEEDKEDAGEDTKSQSEEEDCVGRDSSTRDHCDGGEGDQGDSGDRDHSTSGDRSVGRVGGDNQGDSGDRDHSTSGDRSVRRVGEGNRGEGVDRDHSASSDHSTGRVGEGDRGEGGDRDHSARSDHSAGRVGEGDHVESSDNDLGYSLIESLKEECHFMEVLAKFHRARGTPIIRHPVMGQKSVDLFKLHHFVKEYGGMEKVTKGLKWRQMYLKMGLPPNQTNCSSAIKHAYKRYLLPFRDSEECKKIDQEIEKRRQSFQTQSSPLKSPLSPGSDSLSSPVLSSSLPGADPTPSPQDAPLRGSKHSSPEKVRRQVQGSSRQPQIAPEGRQVHGASRQPQIAPEGRQVHGASRQPHVATEGKQIQGASRTEGKQIQDTSRQPQVATEGRQVHGASRQPQVATERRQVQGTRRQPQVTTEDDSKRSRSMRRTDPQPPISEDKDPPTMTRDSPSSTRAVRESPTSNRDSPSTVRDSPSTTRDSPSTTRDPPTDAVIDDEILSGQTGEEGDMREAQEGSKGQYMVGDKIAVSYGKGKAPSTYEAKIIDMNVDKDSNEIVYHVHYNGWNNRYNEWIHESRVVGKVSIFSVRQYYKKKHPKRSQDDVDRADGRDDTIGEAPQPPNEGRRRRRGRPHRVGGPSRRRTVSRPSALTSQTSMDDLVDESPTGNRGIPYESMTSSSYSTESPPPSIQESRQPSSPGNGPSSSPLEPDGKEESMDISGPLSAEVTGPPSVDVSSQLSVDDVSDDEEEKLEKEEPTQQSEEEAGGDEILSREERPGINSDVESGSDQEDCNKEGEGETPEVEESAEESKSLLDLKDTRDVVSNDSRDDTNGDTVQQKNDLSCDQDGCTDEGAVKEELSENTDDLTESLKEENRIIPSSPPIQTPQQDAFLDEDTPEETKSPVHSPNQADSVVDDDSSTLESHSPGPKQLSNASKSDEDKESDDRGTETNEDVPSTNQEQGQNLGEYDQQVKEEGSVLSGHSSSSHTKKNLGEGKKKAKRSPRREEESPRKRIATLLDDATNPWILDFGAMPNMIPSEKIHVILLKMKEMRQCYSELRGRVGHIERKKRRAKRREKELQAQSQAKQQTHNTPSSTTVECS